MMGIRYLTHSNQKVMSRKKNTETRAMEDLRQASKRMKVTIAQTTRYRPNALSSIAGSSYEASTSNCGM